MRIITMTQKMTKEVMAVNKLRINMVSVTHAYGVNMLTVTYTNI